MLLGEVEKEIFLKYKAALVALGVDFNHWEVIEALEDCTHDLESRFRAVIAWYVWLKKKHEHQYEYERYLPCFTEILIRAFREEWQPIGWKNEFLSLSCCDFLPQ